MKKSIFFIMLATVFTACNTENRPESAGTVIGKQPLEVKDGRLSAEILHLLGQVSGVSLSPDGKTVLYAV
ncbi:MAG: hypothetical protein LBI65_02570, partial [Candidatus Symbiothrix sp.]|nr:hypothetical protein [Candidatus Symbiothrix sp.]